MSDDGPFSSVSSYPDKNSRKSHFVGIFFIILLVVIVILVGLYFLGASTKDSFTQVLTSKPSPTGSSSASSKQTPTPSPTSVVLERSELQVAVLNGSGVEGAARTISTHLDDLGYTIKTVDNAKRFDYKGVTVLIKKDKDAYLDMLKKDLAEKAASVSASVDDTIATDVEIIVGK